MERIWYSLPFLIMAVWAMALAGQAWQRSRAPGSLTFALLMLALTVWLSASAGSMNAVSAEQKLLWARMAYVGTVWIGSLWLAFAIDYTKPDSRLFRRYGPLLLPVPLVTLVLVFTNELHGWIWSSVTAQPGAPENLVFTRGWWLYFFLGYSYLLMAAGLVVLISRMRGAGYRKRQIAALSLGMVIPWLANLGFVFGWVGGSSFDITPYAFAPGALTYAWALFQMGLFQTEQRARDLIFENIDDGVVGLDEEDRVVEVNPAARALLRLPAGPLQGSPAQFLLAQWPDLQALLAGEREQVELSDTSRAEVARTWEVTRTAWFRPAHGPPLRFLVLHDISARKRVEAELSQSEQRYRILVNASPVGMVSMDLYARVTFLSPEACQLLAIPPGTSTAESTLFDFVSTEEHAVLRTNLARLRLGERLPPAIYGMKCFDGSMFWGELATTAVVEEAGKLTGLVTAMRDVSVRKRVEDSLRSHLEQETFSNDLLQVLYHPQDVQAALDAVLERVGMFMHASRVYLCQDTVDGDSTVIVAEWCASSIGARAREAPLLRYDEVPSWRYSLETRGMLLLPHAEARRPILQADEADTRAYNQALPERPATREMTIPPDLAEFMNAWGAVALAVFPVFGQENRLEGFLAIDDCYIARTWTNEEIRMLWNVTKLVAGALAQRSIERAEQQQRVMSEALQDTAQVLNSTLHLEEVFDRILDNIRRVAPHDAASVAMVEDQRVHFVRWRGFNQEGEQWLTNNRVPLSTVPTYRDMAETGNPVVIADTWTDSRWQKLAANGWIRSYLGVPIRIQGQVAGFLNLDSAAPDFFDMQMAERVSVFADQVALAIQNARLYQDAQRRVEEMSTLYRIGLTLTSGLEMNKVLENIFEQCRQVLPIDVFLVALYDQDSKIITPGLYYRNGEFAAVPARSIATSPGVTGAVIKARRTIHIGDTLQPEQVEGYQLIREGGRAARAYVGVPMIMLDSVLGVISMQSYTPYAYNSEQIRLLETITSQAAIAVQNARLYDQMRQMAITDSVTGLYTRRHFTMLGQGEVDRALRYNRVVSVLMVDIDWFKHVNDTYGHSTGDLVLKAVARVCSQALRTTDIVGRWGGEEFTVFLPEADIEGAALIAERIRSMVEETNIPLPDGSAIRLTVSLGVASLNKQAETLEDLVDAADLALYQAKQAGRNRVRIWKPVEA